jgi:hypothetical protein
VALEQERTTRCHSQRVIPRALKGFSRKILQRGIDGLLGSLKTEAEHRASSA